LQDGRSATEFDALIPMQGKLIRPTADLEASYRAYLDELGDEERFPFTLDLDSSDFAAFLRRLDDFEYGRNLRDGRVGNTTYWWIEAGEVVGAANLRHHLNRELLAYGGHIGLGVRPSMRSKGVGVRLLQATVEQAWQRGIGDVHIHCHRSNVASERMIRRAGGELRTVDPDRVPGDEVLRFVIPGPA
jgi:predicted acetyltransferase